MHYGGGKKNTTVAKHYGRVSETPCFPVENTQDISTDSELIYGDSELIRRNIFNTAGSFGQHSDKSGCP